MQVVDEDTRSELVDRLTNPGADRIWYLADAFRAGFRAGRNLWLLGRRSVVLGSD